MTAAYPLPAPTAGSGPARRARSFPGEPRQVARARAFVAAALAGCPAREALLTCVSELAANAVVHTASGAGGAFTVEVIRPADGVALVAVTDEGGQGRPSAPASGSPSAAAVSNWSRPAAAAGVTVTRARPAAAPSGRRRRGQWPSAAPVPPEPHRLSPHRVA